jgi:hypothetical protein
MARMRPARQFTVEGSKEFIRVRQYIPLHSPIENPKTGKPFMQIPKSILLTPEEQVLLEQISFDHDLSHERLELSCNAAEPLARSLLKRGAIPKVRLQYFTDPEFNVGGRGKSRKDVFERNGTKGDAILGHGNFLKYLKYFIYGPDLSPSTIAGFRKIVDDDFGTSGMVMDQLRKFARAEMRQVEKGQRYRVPEEFFKLAIESSLNVDEAASILEAARSVR